MKRVLIVFSFVAIAAVQAMAATPVASVTSSSAFSLRGNRVNVDGVPSWPVMAGDDIATQSGQAVIQLRDGSRVELQGNSHAKVESEDRGLVLRLLSGAMRILNLDPSKTKTQFYTQSALAKPVVGSVISVGPTPIAAPAPVSMQLTFPGPVSRR